MKLGVSYNVFDGEELLEDSIKQIRSEVDFISVVYQKISNFGSFCDNGLIPLIQKLKDEGLVDFIYEYIPVVQHGGHYNEITKRNIGLLISIENNCTHHMSMDTDEFYIKDQFKYLKDDIIKNDYDTTYCQMKTYYKNWEYQLDPPEDYFVSLIYKIRPNIFFEFNTYAPVLLDPTRRMKIEKYKIYQRDEIEMHHGSYVRDNLESKLNNSSIPKEYKSFVGRIVDHFIKWEYPNDILWMGYPPVYKQVKKIKSLF